MGLFKRKKLTPEELEEKSRKEQEWAQKCFDAGSRFGERIRIDKKVERINEFGNKYPKTFFGIVFGIIIGCFLLNLLIKEGSNLLNETSGNIKTATLPKDTGKENLNREIKVLYNEFIRLNELFEEKMANPEKNREDSVEILRIYNRMEKIQQIIFEKEGKENVEWVDLLEEKEELQQLLNALSTRTTVSHEDSMEIQSITARLKLVEELIESNTGKKEEEK